MTANEDVARSQYRKQVLLDILAAAARQANRFGLSLGQLRRGFGRSTQADYSEADMVQDLTILESDDLIARQYDEELAESWYRATGRGLKFHLAGCPWEKIDEFCPGGKSNQQQSR